MRHTALRHEGFAYKLLSTNTRSSVDGRVILFIKKIGAEQIKLDVIKATTLVNE